MTDAPRGPYGLWRKGHSGNPGTMFKPGDPDNPRTRQKRERAARGKEPNAAAALRREEMRAELVALDVMERLLCGARDTTLRRLPRLPDDPKEARREAKRLAARSKARALRAMQRIARDPEEAPEVRLAIVQMLLKTNEAAAPAAADVPGKGGKKKEPKVIVVRSPIARRAPDSAPNPPCTESGAAGTQGAGTPEPAAPPPAREPFEALADTLRREAEDLRERYGD